MRKLVVACAMALAGVASAGTIAGNRETCNEFATLAHNVIVMRDAGVPAAAILKQLDHDTAEAVAAPDKEPYWVKDADDARFVKAVISKLLAEWRSDPMAAGRMVFKGCMSST